MSVQAMKHGSVPESLVVRSFREGLGSETSNRSRRKPKENAHTDKCERESRLTPKAAFSFFLGDSMDKLYECAKGFEKLLSKKYHIIIGRKGKAVELNIRFEDVEFHHLIGLHKLKELRVSRGNRAKIFTDILSGKIFLSDIEKSRYYDTIKDRLEPLAKIETLFDNNKLIFRYDEKKQTFSVIEAEYLLSTPYENTDVYIF